MFAVLKTGGKQYKVHAGDTLRIEKLAANAGETIQFNEILMLGGDAPVIGAPFVDGAAVQAEVVDQIRGEKVIHFVKRRRKHSSQRTKGHRQSLTVVRVTEILSTGAGASGVKAAIGAGSGFVTTSSDAATMATPKAVEAPKSAEPKAAEPKAAAVDSADDLTHLSGVGPKLAQKLLENGVTTFAQIAAWTEDDIADMDGKLSFKGRIEREGWVEQAQAIVAEKE